MIIYWFGQSCFKIEGEKSILITDPLADNYGLKMPRLSGDVVLLSQLDDQNETVKSVGENKPFVINGPGEYEVKNIFIYGIHGGAEKENSEKANQNIIYRLEIDGISLGFLGNLNNILSDGQIERLEGVDILTIPVGGNGVLNAKQATEVISQLEPRLVIPMYYSLPGLKAKLDSVSGFCKEIGVCPKETLNKFKINKKDLPQQDLQVVILQP
jgi:L-ascorbate metabolism protein UlaG (beta-lactamase superfamily)